MSLWRNVRELPRVSKALIGFVFNRLFCFLTQTHSDIATKIKLVAIAKDEAAYLPEWLFHHLHFGFHQISVYVNNTSDNTKEIQNALLNESRIEFLDGNPFFKPSIKSPQLAVYWKELMLSRRQGFSHVMFLDLDEYWFPKDFSTKISDFLEGFSGKVVAFEWFNRQGEEEAFLPVVERILFGRKKTQVKSIIRCNALVTGMNPHSVLGIRLEHQLADKSTFRVTRNNFSKVSKHALHEPVKDAFILHRMQRSQQEYVARLGNGRPLHKTKIMSCFKDNRRGFEELGDDALQLDFSPHLVEAYHLAFHKFINQYDLSESLVKARNFILDRIWHVLDQLEKAPEYENEVIDKIFRGVNIPEVLERINVR